MVRTGKSEKLVEAMQHAKKYLAPYMETKSKEIHRAAGLLAFPSNTETEPYKVFLSLQIFGVEVADFCGSRCTRHPAGSTSPTCSCERTMNSYPFRRGRCSISPCRQVSRRSRHRRATRPTLPAGPTHSRRQRLFALFAPLSSTSWRATCRTRTTPRAMSSTTRSSCPTGACMGGSDCSRQADRPARGR